MDRINIGESDGYRKALLMFDENIDTIFDECKRFKIKMTSKIMHNILKVIIENRQLLKNNPFAFVRYNCVSNVWEVFVQTI